MRETLPVLYRDAHLLAVDKPSGLLVHRSLVDRHETRFALQIVRNQIGQRVFPLHRLDKGTSGVLLFALDPLTARLVGRSFDGGLVDKRYLAVVRGWMPAAGTIDHPLVRCRDGYGESTTVDASGIALKNLQVSQAALTRFRCLALGELDERVDVRQSFPTTRYSLAELQPVTGRQHQLRRHLKHLAHPIVGDATYGKGIHNRFFAGRYGVSRLLLACRSITLPHPADGRPLHIVAPVPHEFVTVAEAFGWAIDTLAELISTSECR